MKNSVKYTRKIDPRLGLLGFLGFLGFLGIVTFRLEHVFFPFIFFGFFGFFGLRYEGKMSSTLMDERFLLNRHRADRKAYSVCFYATLASLLLANVNEAGWAWLAEAAGLQVSEMKLMFLTIALALSLGLSVFLSPYLLYRYDHEDCEEGEL